jgi:hypothetical protein
MSSKIDILNILKDHKKTLVDQNSNKPGGDDIFYFLILPLGIHRPTNIAKLLTIDLLRSR